MYEITVDDGRPAERRFEDDMRLAGHDTWRYDPYSHIELCCTPPMAERVRRGIGQSYEPTALFWRTSPDFCVRERGGACWLADVKGASPEHRNLALEVTQLMNLFLMEELLWLDVRYVYLTIDGTWRWNRPSEVMKQVQTVYVNERHPSCTAYRRLCRQTEATWTDAPNKRFYDPYALIAPAAVAQWPLLTIGRRSQPKVEA